MLKGTQRPLCEVTWPAPLSTQETESPDEMLGG